MGKSIAKETEYATVYHGVIEPYSPCWECEEALCSVVIAPEEVAIEYLGDDGILVEQVNTFVYLAECHNCKTVVQYDDFHARLDPKPEAKVIQIAPFLVKLPPNARKVQ